MTIIDQSTDGIEPCQCGFKPVKFSIGYGRTPYSIHCDPCRKSLHGGCNNAEWFFSFWNEHVRQVKRENVMYGLRYEDKEGCRLNPPRIYETSCMGLFEIGEPLN